MRIFIAVLVLIFSFQSWTKADDIRDFEIDGLSIGLSLLDLFSKEQIESEKATYYKNNEFSTVSFGALDPKYDEIQASWRTSNKKYIIESLAAGINQDNIEECYKKMEKVSEELGSFFKIKPDKKNSNPNPWGLFTYITIPFQSGDEVTVSCYDYEDKFDYIDIFRINIDTKDFRYWIDNKAYIE